MSSAVSLRADSSFWNASSVMFFFALLNAVSMSPGGTSIFIVAAFATRMSCTIRSFSRLSSLVSVSSAERFCDSSRVRRYAFSTSACVIFRPSTTAQVSGETLAVFAPGAFAVGVDRHAPSSDAVMRMSGSVLVVDIHSHPTRDRPATIIRAIPDAPQSRHTHRRLRGQVGDRRRGDGRGLLRDTRLDRDVALKILPDPLA